MSASEDSKTAIRPADETAATPPERKADATERFTPGTLVAGRYRIVSPLGKGGMGEVYRADDIRLGQPVALKFLPASLAADPGRFERLVDEVRLGRQISHPNVCRLYDIAETEGHHFMVMEYVDGEDLASLLRRIGRLPGGKALEIARGLCAGLAAAHDKGIIHRDLKPANVMIDGRGHARIADFGLAALADGVSTADMSGTPHYMAPEQLAGQGASLRSDVYALGLVLHEMLTGKRVFEAKSMGELRALHAETKPTSLSSSGTDVDPGFDRVVQRCLAKDPSSRPASAREVLLSLPGGDPLQAAILAGETPSPEMVAAAGKVGDVSPAVAWACLLAGLAGLLAVTNRDGRALFRQASLPKPPEALVEMAKDLRERLGYPEPGVDSAYGFTVETEFIDYVQKGGPENQERALRETRPGPFLFYYRESPAPLVANTWLPAPPWEGPSQLGRVFYDEPPIDLPGMTGFVLDSHGRLVRFVAVPPAFNAEDAPAPEPDWLPVLREAGFDPADLRGAPSRWSLSVAADQRAAWEGPLAGQPGMTFHIEAAAWRGSLVSFEMRGPWIQPPPPIRPSEFHEPLPMYALLVLGLVLLPLGMALARRNVELGRGDRRGASRLAVFTFVSLTLADVLRADHTSLPVDEYTLLLQILSQATYAAVTLWVLYLALEPAVRRRWPEALISWNRLLAGRFRDPMLGRDVLVGTIAGTTVALLLQSTAILFVLSTLLAPRHLAYYFLKGVPLGLAYNVIALFMLYLLHLLTRRVWLARLLLLVIFALTSMVAMQAPRAEVIPTALLFAAIIWGVLTRFGLVASTVLWFTESMLLRTPLTLDLAAWYSGRSLAVLGLFAGLLLVSAYTSLGGKPIFGKALLDD